METARPGTGRAFFDTWFNFQAIHVDHKLPRVHDKKLTVLALCALMELHPSAIPEILEAGWSGIVAGILRIFTDLESPLWSTIWPLAPCMSCAIFASAIANKQRCSNRFH